MAHFAKNRCTPRTHARERALNSGLGLGAAAAGALLREGAAAELPQLRAAAWRNSPGSWSWVLGDVVLVVLTLACGVPVSI